MNVHIIYHKLFDYHGDELTIGGIQTYLINLSKVLTDNGLNVTIYQLGDHDWNLEYKGIRVIGVQRKNFIGGEKASKIIFDSLVSNISSNDLIIWGSDSIAIKTPGYKSLSIQHGIGFDFIANNTNLLKRVKKFKLEFLYKFFQRWKSIRNFTKSDYQVCVDYNYLNWIRTMLPRCRILNANVIPNFTKLNESEKVFRGSSDKIKILYARRFSEERGVFILLDIIEELTNKYENIEFTVAGDGPLSEVVYEKCKNIPNVAITSYAHNESLDIHTKHDIAIVPTIGSEGTSLSLLEAMTTGCAVIASNVGGMTNIILDGYNGFLVNPSAPDFVDKISYLIENDNERQNIGVNAKLSIDAAFSIDQWTSRWVKLIQSIEQEDK